jgi:hypothetical protein
MRSEVRRWYHLWSSNFHDLARASAESRLTTLHLSCIREHEHAYERIRILVPGNNGCCLSFAIRIIIDRDVNVTDLVVHDGDQIDTGNTTDDTEGVGVCPSVVHKLGISNDTMSMRWPACR